MRSELLLVIGLLALAALWSSVELYAAFIHRGAPREVSEKQAVQSCTELLLSTGCRPELPLECRALCASEPSVEKGAGASAARPSTSPLNGSAANERSASGLAGNASGVPAAEDPSDAGADEEADADSDSDSDADAAADPAADEDYGADRPPPARNLTRCAQRVEAGACFSDPVRMLRRCRDDCVPYRGLPREISRWRAPRECFANGAPGLVRHDGLPAVDPVGYVQLVGGREQMNKHRFLVLDGLFYAHALNRTFVEPAVANSRLVESPRRARELLGSSETLGFGSYWEMDSLCAFHRTIDLVAFTRLNEANALRSVLVLPRTARETRIGGINLETERQVQAAFEPFTEYKLIQLDTFYRSSLLRPVALRLSPKIEAFAKRLAKSFMGAKYMAVQWRSETVARDRWEPCVEYVSAVVQRIASRLRFGGMQILLISDVFPDTSDTDFRGPSARLAALRKFEEKMPGIISQPIHPAIAMIADSGIKAIVEQYLAINAPYFFAASMGETNKVVGEGGTCAKPGSGFVDTIVRERLERGLKSYPLLHVRLTNAAGKVIESFGGPNVGETTVQRPRR